VLRDGQLDVPKGPGTGVEVNMDLIRAFALGAPLVLHTTG
jgi:L-alanine-DL-glutamate epimerase-like enolase superfamily enzyme